MSHKHKRILFIVKKNETYGWKSYCRRNSGLWNSTEFVACALRKHHVHAEVVEVTDNNDIDREVTRFRPDAVVIEALWVIPEKFDVLKKLHPRVQWFVHLHSNIPFLANEGVAVSWIHEYYQRGVDVIVNSRAAQCSISTMLGTNDPVIFCPNIYEGDLMKPKAKHCGQVINIGSFGAIRPMKNQLGQAIAALAFAREEGKLLRFHINGFRVEHGDSVLRNLEALFEYADDAELVVHPWYEHEQFVHILRNEIDIGMQVSLSETFNVVTADYIAAGLPVVVSPEVNWVSCWNQAPCDSIPEITRTLRFVYNRPLLVRWNQRLLKNYAEDATEHWLRFLRHL